MLTTPFGNICITMDDKPIPYAIAPVQNSKLFPDVSGAYVLAFEYLSDGVSHELHCVLDAPSVKGGIESGERLEAISFYDDQRKLTIGCEGCFGDPDEYNYDYDGDYLSNGLTISITPATKSKVFLVGVAWLDLCTKENDVQTWFAADPTITGNASVF